MANRIAKILREHWSQTAVEQPPWAVEEDIYVPRSSPTPSQSDKIEEVYEVPPVAPTPEPPKDGDSEDDEIKEDIQDNDPVSKIVNLSETTARLDYESDFEDE